MKLAARFLLLGLPLLWLGCAGYHVGNVPPTAMKGVKNIWVPMVKNDTFTPYLQPMVTNAVIHALDNDGTFHTARAGTAEATLNITVVDFQRYSIQSNPNNDMQTTEYRAVLTARATLINNLTGQVVFRDLSFTGSTEYYVPDFNEGGDNVEAERQAMPLAGAKLAQQIVQQVAEGW